MENIEQTQDLTNKEGSAQNLKEISTFSTLIDYLISDTVNKADEEILEVIDTILKDKNSSSSSSFDADLKADSIFFDLANSTDKGEALALFYLNFYLELTQEPKIYSKIISQKEKLQMITRLLNAAKTLKTRQILRVNTRIKQKALDDFIQVNLVVLPQYVELFDITSEDEEALINTVNRMIEQNKKIETTIKYIEIFNLKNNANLNKRKLLDFTSIDKSKANVVKKLVKIFPEELNNAIYTYLSTNDTKLAGELANDNEEVLDPNVKSLIFYKSKVKALHFHYNQYKKKEASFVLVIEAFHNDFEVLSCLINILIDDMLFFECLFLLDYYDSTLR